MSDEITGKVIAGEVLTATAGKTATMIDHFTSWLVAGFAAVLALLLSNADNDSSFISIYSIKTSSLIFLAAVVVASIEKYLALIIINTADVAAATKASNKPDFSSINKKVLEVFLNEVKLSVFKPGRWFVERSISKMEKGDLAASGRNFFKCAQVLGGLSLIVSILLLWATFVLVLGIRS